ncbi:unnamed protein product [Bubo scandiacus]
MAERPPSSPRVVWEEVGAPQESSSPLEPCEVTTVRPLQMEEMPEKPEWDSESIWLLSSLDSSDMTMVFGEYLQPSQKTDVLLVAIEALTADDVHDRQMGSDVVDMAMTDPASWLTAVPEVLRCIHTNMEQIRAEPARRSLDSLLLLLTRWSPREVVRSLLAISPTCDSAAMAMWEVMISMPWALRTVLSELLGVLRDWRLRRVFSSAVEDACIYPLALLVSADIDDKQFAALYETQRYLRRPSPVMLSLVLAGLTTLSKTPETARKMLVLLPDIMENLPAANSDVTMKALMLFINVIPHMKREEAKFIALRLAEKLLLLFDDESSRVRELSIRLFKDVMKTAVGRNTKKMVKKVQGAVLPLFFHTNEKIESVAKASWDTLRTCAEFLGWRRLSFLAETGQTPLIRECLITHKRNSADEYLLQSLLYVENPQASVREAAVRFIALQSLENDAEHSIRSLAAQTVLILTALKQKPSPTEPLLSLLLLQTMAVFITRILTLLSIAQYVLRVGDQEDAATQELLRQREEQERQEMTWLLEVEQRSQERRGLAPEGVLLGACQHWCFWASAEALLVLSGLLSLLLARAATATAAGSGEAPALPRSREDDEDWEGKAEPSDTLPGEKPLQKAGSSAAPAKQARPKNSFPTGPHPALGRGSAYECPQSNIPKHLLLALLRPPLGHVVRQRRAPRGLCRRRAAAPPGSS